MTQRPQRLQLAGGSREQVHGLVPPAGDRLGASCECSSDGGLHRGAGLRRYLGRLAGEFGGALGVPSIQGDGSRCSIRPRRGERQPYGLGCVASGPGGSFGGLELFERRRARADLAHVVTGAEARELASAAGETAREIGAEGVGRRAAAVLRVAV